MSDPNVMKFRQCDVSQTSDGWLWTCDEGEGYAATLAEALDEIDRAKAREATKMENDDLREAVARAKCRHFRSGTEYEEDHPYRFWHDFLPKADAAIAVVVERCAAQCDDLARGARKLELQAGRTTMGRERGIAAETLADEIRALARKDEA